MKTCLSIKLIKLLVRQIISHANKQSFLLISNCDKTLKKFYKSYQTYYWVDIHGFYLICVIGYIVCIYLPGFNSKEKLYKWLITSQAHPG